MTATSTTPDPVPDAGSPALDERLFLATTGALELLGVYLGTRLGLYETVRDHGPVTSEGLAAAARVDARYAREWLEQQAVAGFLSVDDPAQAPDERRYRLPAEHVGVLTDDTDPGHVTPFADMIVGIAGAIDQVVDAYRTGAGVAFADYGAALRRGQGGINRPAFESDLVTAWLPAAGVHDRLSRPGARVADLGCGVGWSSIALAQAYPGATIVGIDDDIASIEDARANAAERAVDVTFDVADAPAMVDRGPFDVILMLEMLHDLAHPVDVLRACHDALAEGGVVVVADENVAEQFQAPGDELERMMYGWSITHCLPAARAEEHSAAIGTVIRPDTVRTLATHAGFDRVETVDVDAGFFRLYRIHDAPGDR